MQEKTVQLKYKEGKDISELSDEEQALVKETIQFSGNAYAPYSNFHVSAGLILDNGKVIKGTNVENASYPVSICAERTLLAHVISNYPKNKIKTMAVYVDREVGKPVSPCGICRQTLLEAELNQKSPIQVILIAKEGNFLYFESAADLLPLYFDGETL